MIDLTRLVQDEVASFESAKSRDFPLLVGNDLPSGNNQHIDGKDVSHLSHFSHQKSAHHEPHNETDEKYSSGFGEGTRASRMSSGTVGTVGKVGNASKINAILFPPTLEEVGKVGKGPAGRSINDPSLYPRQHDPGRCFVCGAPEDGERPLLPVLTPRSGDHHWIHAGCRGEHSRRIEAAWHEANRSPETHSSET